MVWAKHINYTSQFNRLYRKPTSIVFIQANHRSKRVQNLSLRSQFLKYDFSERKWVYELEEHNVINDIRLSHYQ
jgi:hypothetical protein